MTSWDDLDPIARADLDAIRSAFDRAKQLAPSDPRWSPGSARSEQEICAIEARLDFRLPAALRAYFLAIGDGGAGFPSGGIPKLETLDAADPMAATARFKHPFPLKAAWSDPATIEEWKAAKLYAKNKTRFYTLAEGARPTDGTMAFGATADRALYQLVLRGPHAGTVWIDSTAYDLGGVAPADPPQFLALQRHWIELELRRLEQRQLIVQAAREGRLEALLADARSEDERRDIVTELVKEGFAILEAETLRDAPDHEVCRAAIALVALGEDEVRIGKALLMAGAFAELETFARSVLGRASSVRVARDRAAVHLVVALAALGRGAEIANVRVGPELAYMSPYKGALHRAVARLEDAAKRDAFRNLPLRVAVDVLLADDDVGAGLAVDVADRLLRVAVGDAAMENHAYNAGNRLVDALEDELEAVAPELAEPLARLFVYVDASAGRFEAVAAATRGALEDGAVAKKRATAWLLAHEAELTGETPTARAKERFRQLRGSA